MMTLPSRPPVAIRRPLYEMLTASTSFPGSCCMWDVSEVLVRKEVDIAKAPANKAFETALFSQCGSVALCLRPAFSRPLRHLHSIGSSPLPHCGKRAVSNALHCVCAPPSVDLCATYNRLFLRLSHCSTLRHPHFALPFAFASLLFHVSSAACLSLSPLPFLRLCTTRASHDQTHAAGFRQQVARGRVGVPQNGRVAASCGGGMV